MSDHDHLVQLDDLAHEPRVRLEAVTIDRRPHDTDQRSIVELRPFFSWKQIGDDASEEGQIPI